MTPIIQYLRDDKLSEDKSKARLLRLKVARYILYDRRLYRRGFLTPLLKCVNLEERNYILQGRGLRESATNSRDFPIFPITSRETHLYDLAQAFRGLGNRSYRPTTNNATYFQICYSRSQLLHKVGQGQNASKDLQQKGPRFCMGSNNMSIWHTSGDRLK